MVTWTRQQECDVQANKTVLGKRDGYIVRVAGILHLLNVAAGSAEHGSEIGIHLVRKAVEIVDVLQAYAIEAHKRASQGEDGDQDLMRRIHALGLRGACKPRDIARKLPVRLRKRWKAASIKLAMENLQRLELGTWDGTAFTSKPDTAFM
jgi:hypothetical protein